MEAEEERMRGKMKKSQGKVNMMMAMLLLPPFFKLPLRVLSSSESLFTLLSRVFAIEAFDLTTNPNANFPSLANDDRMICLSFAILAKNILKYDC